MALTVEQQTQLKALLDAKVLTQDEYNAKVNPPEGFDGKKFVTGLVKLNDPVLWAKDIHDMFNIRALIIYALIAGAVFGWGFLKGNANKPVHIDGLGDKEFSITVTPNEILQVKKDGTVRLTNVQGKVLKTIEVKDIPQLEKALKPIGFQLKPIAVAGYGIGSSGSSFEGGLGVSYFKFYNTSLDMFATNKAIYPIAVSYRLEKLGSGNSSVGLGLGKGYAGDTRLLGYWKWEF